MKQHRWKKIEEKRAYSPCSSLAEKGHVSAMEAVHSELLIVKDFTTDKQ